MNARTLAEIRPLPVPLDDDERPVARDLMSTLALISQARRQLAEAQTVPDVLRIEAQAKAGLLVQALQESGILAQHGRPGKRSGGRTFSEAGIEKRDAHLWRRVAAISDARRQEYLREARAAGRDVTTNGLLRHAARVASRSQGLDPAAIHALARRQIRSVYHGLTRLPDYDPRALVSALDRRERRELRPTLRSELDVLLSADRELRSQPWYPIQPGDVRIVFQGGHAFGVADQHEVAEHCARRLNEMSAPELRRLAEAARKAGRR